MAWDAAPGAGSLYRVSPDGTWRVKAGAKVTVKAVSYPDKVFEGKVDWVSGAFDRGTRTAQVRCTFPNPDKLLKPGATEPTDLAIAIGHKGFAWVEVEVFGRAAHGSRPAEGIDAILRLGRILVRLAVSDRVAPGPHRRSRGDLHRQRHARRPDASGRSRQARRRVTRSA